VQQTGAGSQHPRGYRGRQPWPEEAIAAASRGLNHTDAEAEVRAFCDYIIDPTLDRDGIDDLIADYINTAERMVEEAENR
jgi:hypothetical protein